MFILWLLQQCEWHNAILCCRVNGTNSWRVCSPTNRPHRSRDTGHGQEGKVSEWFRAVSRRGGVDFGSCIHHILLSMMAWIYHWSTHKPPPCHLTCGAASRNLIQVQHPRTLNPGSWCISAEHDMIVTYLLLCYSVRELTVADLKIHCGSLW